MKIDKGIINKVQQLARLELSQEEIDEFTVQLNDIINYVEKINELDTNNVQPVDHIVDLNNVFREDKVTESLPIEKVKSIACEFENNHFVVPKIIEDNK